MSKDRDITIFIGNGLGMELNPWHFSLKNTLNDIWKNFEDKDFIDFCKKINDEVLPNDEEGFAKVHSFFEGLRSIEFSKDHIQVFSKDHVQMKISDEIVPVDIFGYLRLYDKLILEITKHFFNYDIHVSKKYENFRRFMGNLKKFIKDNHKKGIKTHVITTNYDKLLYASFCDEKDDQFQVFAKTFNRSTLIDGFYKRNSAGNVMYDIKNFYSYYQQNKLKCGSYLAIHGSPLFYTDSENSVCKFNRNDVGDLKLDIVNKSLKRRNDVLASHLILCSSKQKMIKILTSPLLMTYFEVFKQCVRHSKKIVIIGYGGLDSHIMDVFKNDGHEGCKFYIVEHEREGKGEQHWTKWIKDFSYIPKPSIFDFNILNDIP